MSFFQALQAALNKQTTINPAHRLTLSVAQKDESGQMNDKDLHATNLGKHQTLKKRMLPFQKIWVPSPFGRFFTNSPVWSLSLKNNDYLLELGGSSLAGNIPELEQAKVVYGLFWTSIALSIAG